MQAATSTVLSVKRHWAVKQHPACEICSKPILPDQHYLAVIGLFPRKFGIDKIHRDRKDCGLQVKPKGKSAKAKRQMTFWEILEGRI